MDTLYQLSYNGTKETKLFRLFMWVVCLALLAELFEFQTGLDRLLILCRMVHHAFAGRAFEFNEVVLRHTDNSVASAQGGWSRWSDLNRRPAVYKTAALTS